MVTFVDKVLDPSVAEPRIAANYRRGIRSALRIIREREGYLNDELCDEMDEITTLARKRKATA